MGSLASGGASPITTGSTTTAGPTSAMSPDGITINLANASVQEVAKTVLGDVLGFNYVVSDKINATVTLRTVRPVDKAGLFEIFETVLRAQDIAVVADGAVYKVVPAADAQAMGAPLRPRKLAMENGKVGIATEIVPLKYVSASEMQRILKSAAPQASVLLVDSARNMLLVSGTKSELRSMSELVDVFDVDWMRGMSFGIFPIETGDPEAIAQELDVVFANDKESPTKGIVRFVPNKRLKSVLVISSRPEYLKKAETWLARIDLASRATEKGVFVYHVQNRPANEVAQLLQKVYKPSGGTSSSSSSSSSGALDPSRAGLSGAPAGGEAPAASSGGGGVGSFAVPAISPPAQPGTGGASGTGAPAAGTADAGSAGGASAPAGEGPSAGAAIGGGAPPDDRNSGITIVSDEPNNSLIITATPVEYKRIHHILETIDVAGNQVMIEATIAEVTLTDDLKFGVRWFFQKGESQIGLSETSTLGSLANHVFPGFSYLLQATDINAVVHALNTITDVNVVSSPTLMVVENKKAQLQVGDEVPIATQSAVATTSPGSPIVNSISFRNTGVILGITPRVSDSGRVVLDIEQEVSGVTETTTSTIDSPTIQQRRVKTTVNVDDGHSIILAGLIQENATRKRGQVPLLGNVPYVGNLFKDKTDTIKRTELLIAITPHVIKDRVQIDEVTAEYRDRLNFSTRPQRTAQPDARETFDRLQR